MMGGVYGPVSFPGSGRARQESERVHIVRSHGPRSPASYASLRSSLGPGVASELRSRATRTALKAYHYAPRETGDRGRVHPVARQVTSPKSEMRTGSWDDSWHPGRFSEQRGSGMSLLHSRATQRALREMRAHESLRHESAESKSSTPATAEVAGGEALLATKLEGHAGFSNVHSRRQALEAIKDLLEEQVHREGPSALDHRQLSSARSARRARAQREHAMHARHARGRGMGGGLDGALQESRRLGQLHTAMQMGRANLRSQKDMAHARSEEATDYEKRALTIEREEMSKYGQAQMSRQEALREAHRLLGEKAHERKLDERIRDVERRAAEMRKAGEKLETKAAAEKRRFQRLSGPVAQAEKDAKIANQAYTHVELQLANAETMAESLRGNPKLEAEDMAKIQNLQAEGQRMAELVKTATGRLQSTEDNSGPLQGLDSHFFSPKHRAIRMIEQASKVEHEADSLRAKRDSLRREIAAQLPGLHLKIASAKKLHRKYQHLKIAAERAQEAADRKKVGAKRLSYKEHVAEQRLADINDALRGRVHRSE